MTESTNDLTGTKPTAPAEKDHAPTVKASKPQAETGDSDTTVKTTANTTANTTSSVKSGRGLSVFAVLLSLLAIAGAGATWYQTQVQQVASDSSLAVGVANIGGDVARLGDSIARLQGQQAEVVTEQQLANALLQSNNAFRLRLDNLGGQQKALFDAVTKINDDLQKGVNDYVIDEVSQLLKLANNSALFNADASAAVKALSLADIQLKELADPRFAQVRLSINREIALLKGVPQIDTENVSARLSVLASKIPSLPLENEPPVKGSVKLLADEVAEEITWRSELKKIWRDMVNSVQVQRVDQPPKPLLAPQQRYFLNQNLQLSLSKAELALLQNRSSIYVRSLDEASSWLTEYFDMKNSDVQSSLTEIAELKALNVNVELPSVAESYEMLQSIKGGL